MVAKPRPKRAGQALPRLSLRRKSALVVPPPSACSCPTATVAGHGDGGLPQGRGARRDRPGQPDRVPQGAGGGCPLVRRHFSRPHRTQGADICTTQHCQAWRSTPLRPPPTRPWTRRRGRWRCTAARSCAATTSPTATATPATSATSGAATCPTWSACPASAATPRSTATASACASAAPWPWPGRARATSTSSSTTTPAIEVSGESTAQPPDTESRQAAIAKYLVGQPRHGALRRRHGARRLRRRRRQLDRVLRGRRAGRALRRHREPAADGRLDSR